MGVMGYGQYSGVSWRVESIVEGAVQWTERVGAMVIVRERGEYGMCPPANSNCY